MKVLSLLTLFNMSLLLSSATELPVYHATKSGVTVICNGPWDTLASDKSLARLVDFILDKCAKDRNGMKIIILMGRNNINRPLDASKEKIYVCYDNIMKQDTVYYSGSIQKYFQDRNLPEFSLHDRYEINTELLPYSRYDTGLIIFYNWYTSEINHIDRVVGITLYALKNIQRIKNDQKYIRLPLSSRHEHISILSYDPEIMQSIKTENYDFNPYSPYTMRFKIITASLILSFLSFLFYYIHRRRSSPYMPPRL